MKISQISIEDLAKHLYLSHPTGEQLKREWSVDSQLQRGLDYYEKEEYRAMAKAALEFIGERVHEIRLHER